MNTGISTAPGSSRRSFFLFLLLVPVGVFLILAVLLIVQFKQFRSIVSPTPDVPEFVWSDASKARLDSVEADLHAFADGDKARLGGDSLWISAEDLNLLLASSSVAVSHDIRVRTIITDSLVLLQSSQPIQALQGQLAWVFKKLASSGYLNARLEGYPELKNGKLTFFPLSGFLNGHKLPTAALAKQGGFSLDTFMGQREFYDHFVRALGRVQTSQGKILLVHD